MLVTLEYDSASGIAVMTFNRPQALNALNLATAQALASAVEEVKSLQGVRCLALRGAGKAFMAGGDVSAFGEDFDQTETLIHGLLDALTPVVEYLYHTPIPVVACVHGAVAGAGLSLMAACDLAIAADSTRFLMAYDKIGAAPDCGGTAFLPRLLGERRAAALMLLGETWTAQQALDYGLINRMVSDTEFDERCDQLLQQVANGPTLAYGSYKTLTHTRYEGLSQQLNAERAAFCESTRTEDFRAGVSAFLNKQKPHYSGQ